MIGTPIDKAAATKGAIPIHSSTTTSSSSSSSSSILTVSSTAVNSSTIRSSKDSKDSKGYVTDAQGRRRFHGAFTGGFSAGYFNTVGSAEGFTPASFVSNRRDKDGDSTRSSTGSSNVIRQHVRDFMDEEDEQDFNFTNTSFPGASVTKSGSSSSALFQPSELYQHSIDDTITNNSSTHHHHRQPTNKEDVFSSEFILPKRTSIGKLLLHHCGGWIEGMKLGRINSSRKISSSSPPSTAKTDERSIMQNDDNDEDNDEDFAQEIQLLWDEGTSRPPSSHYGLGYNPEALRFHETATSTLLSHQQQQGINSTVSSKTNRSSVPDDRENKRYRLGDILDTNDKHNKFLASLAHTSSSSSVSSNPTKNESTTIPSSNVSTKRKYNLMSFDIDDEEGNNDNIYSEPSLLEYDIPSSHQRTGTSSSRTGNHSTQPPHHPPTHQRQPLALPSTSASTSSSASSSSELHLCADGRPALPGFHLAQRIERTFVTFAKTYQPMIPSHYHLRPHVFNTNDDITTNTPFYRRYGYTIHKIIDTDTTKTTNHRSSSSSTVSSRSSINTSVISPGEWSAKFGTAEETNILKSKFVAGPTIGGDEEEKGIKEGKLIKPREETVNVIPENSGKGEIASYSASAAPVLPRFTVGQTLTPIETVWLPNRLVLKRFNIPDPFTKETRDRLEGKEKEIKDNKGNTIGTFPIIPSDRNNTRRNMGTLDTVTMATDENTTANLSYDTTLASLVYERPPDALYRAIFQSFSLPKDEGK